MEEFYSFPVVLVGIAKIFLLIGLGFGLSSVKIVKKNMADILNVILLWVCFPALMIAKITAFFDVAAFTSWWILPLAGIVMSVLGFGIGDLSQRPFKDFTARREFIASCAFENCGYLPMSLVVFITTGELREKLLICIFLFLTGFNVGMWSFAPPYLSNKQEKGALHKAILNPPVICMIAAFMTAVIFGKGCVPAAVMVPLAFLGDTSFPLSLVLVGIALDVHQGYRLKEWAALTVCVLVKLVIFPLGVLAFLAFIPLDATDKFIIFLEATMPVAVTLLVIGHYEGADNAFLSGSIFYSHLVAIITVPALLYLYSFIF
jgi:predicted permease